MARRSDTEILKDYAAKQREVAARAARKVDPILVGCEKIASALEDLMQRDFAVSHDEDVAIAAATEVLRRHAAKRIDAFLRANAELETLSGGTRDLG